MPLAVFFELFWIDLIPVGGYIPPMPSFPYLLLLSLAGIFGWADAQSLAFPLFICLPLAYVVPLLETRQRNMQKSAYSVLLAHVRSGEAMDVVPGRLILLSAVQIVGLSLLLFVLAWIAVFGFFSLEAIRDLFAFPLSVNWAVLYTIGAIGALMGLRIKRAYILFMLGMAAAALYLL